MSEKKEQIEVKLFYVTQTPKALCVQVDEDETSPEIWLPKWWKGEELAWDQRGLKITIWAPEDLLFEKGLI